MTALVNVAGLIGSVRVEADRLRIISETIEAASLPGDRPFTLSGDIFTSKEIELIAFAYGEAVPVREDSAGPVEASPVLMLPYHPRG